jgi:HK97 family phage major capsid protein
MIKKKEQEILDNLVEMATEIVTELQPAVVDKEQPAVVDKEIDLSNYISKDEVESMIAKKMEAYTKTADLKKSFIDTAFTDTTRRDSEWSAINKAVTGYGIKTDTEEFQKNYKVGNGKVEMTTMREKTDTAMAYELYKAIERKRYDIADKIEAEFADPMSIRTKTLVPGSGSGAYVVPVGYEAMMIKRRDEAFPLIDKLNRMTTETLTGYVPYEISLPQDYWETDIVAAQVSQPVFGTHLYQVKEHRVTTVVSDRLNMGSNLDVMAIILDNQGRALGKGLWKQFIKGTGATSLPFGLEKISVIAAQSIVVGKGIGSFLLASVGMTNLTALEWALPKEYSDDAVWVMNPDTQRRIYAAASPQGYPLFGNEYIVDGVRRTLLGHMIYPNSNVGLVSDDKTSAPQMFLFVPKYFTVVQMKGITINIWDQATIGGVALASQRAKAITTGEYMTMFSTSPYAYARFRQIGKTKVPI